MDLKEIKSLSHSSINVNARHVALYLCRKYTSVSVRILCLLINHCDYSTVIYTERKIEDEIVSNEELAKDILKMEKRIETVTINQPQGMRNYPVADFRIMELYAAYRFLILKWKILTIYKQSYCKYYGQYNRNATDKRYYMRRNRYDDVIFRIGSDDLAGDLRSKARADTYYMRRGDNVL